ncbi:MAG: SMC-Scp complex subunit ScpB [Candidatus Eisenbacteria bacterium]|nr:SMC-Scp complex subunit ScpB [Candidatus Eisenbacteria bacterium]
MSAPELKKKVEALLFAADTAVDAGKLADVLSGTSRGDIREAVRELNEDYERESRSFAIEEVAGGWQFYCKPEYSKWVRELHKGRMSARLSQAALETLAIVAYKQPIVRAEIEIVRGVDASGVLATLLKRDLVRIVGRAPGMGRALMYGTTKEFLRYFGLNSVTDLPRLEEFAEVLGLKPEELELTIEGAESLSAIADREAATASDEDGETTETETPNTPADGAGADEETESGDTPAREPRAEEEPGESSERDEPADGETRPDEPVEAMATRLRPDSAGAAEEAGAEAPSEDGDTIRRVSVNEPPPPGDPHGLSDSDLAQALDED